MRLFRASQDDAAQARNSGALHLQFWPANGLHGLIRAYLASAGGSETPFAPEGCCARIFQDVSALTAKLPG
jgi:hypothetical protein